MGGSLGCGHEATLGSRGAGACPGEAQRGRFPTEVLKTSSSSGVPRLNEAAFRSPRRRPGYQNLYKNQFMYISLQRDSPSNFLVVHWFPDFHEQVCLNIAPVSYSFNKELEKMGLELHVIGGSNWQALKAEETANEKPGRNWILINLCKFLITDERTKQHESISIMQKIRLEP